MMPTKMLLGGADTVQWILKGFPETTERISQTSLPRFNVTVCLA